MNKVKLFIENCQLKHKLKKLQAHIKNLDKERNYFKYEVGKKELEIEDLQAFIRDYLMSKGIDKE